MCYRGYPPPPPPPAFPLSKLDGRHTGRLRQRDKVLTGEGGRRWEYRGAESYDRKEAWPSVNHSVLSGIVSMCLVESVNKLCRRRYLFIGGGICSVWWRSRYWGRRAGGGQRAGGRHLPHRRPHPLPLTPTHHHPTPGTSSTSLVSSPQTLSWNSLSFVTIHPLTITPLQEPAAFHLFRSFKP